MTDEKSGIVPKGECYGWCDPEYHKGKSQWSVLKVPFCNCVYDWTPYIPSYEEMTAAIEQAKQRKNKRRSKRG